jgi:hypothetical protein
MRNVGEGVGSNETSNVEAEVGGESNLINWRSELKGPDEVSEIACDHCPEESEKSL